MPQHLCAHYRLEPPRRAQRVAHHGLGGADVNLNNATERERGTCSGSVVCDVTAENETAKKTAAATAVQVYNNFWRGRRMFCKFRTLVIVPPLLPPQKIARKTCLFL